MAITRDNFRLVIHRIVIQMLCHSNVKPVSDGSTTTADNFGWVPQHMQWPTLSDVKNVARHCSGRQCGPTCLSVCHGLNRLLSVCNTVVCFMVPGSRSNEHAYCSCLVLHSKVNSKKSRFSVTVKHRIQKKNDNFEKYSNSQKFALGISEWWIPGNFQSGISGGPALKLIDKNDAWKPLPQQKTAQRRST